MDCRNCGESIRPTEERDGIDRYPLDGKYEFGYVHDNGPKMGGDPFCDMTLIAEPPDALDSG
jgi:hypothetical protein